MDGDSIDGITERSHEPSFRERFIILLCTFQPQLYYLFVIEIILVVLLLFPLRFVSPGTTPFVILQLNFIVIGATLIPIGVILYVCIQRT